MADGVVHILPSAWGGDAIQANLRPGKKQIWRKHFAWDIFAQWAWTRTLKAWKPETVHFWGDAFCREGVAAAHRVGARVQVTLRHANPWSMPNAALLARADEVFVNQPGLLEYYAQHGVKTQHWTVVPDQVRPFTPKGSRAEMLQKYALPMDALLVFCVGPVQVWKRWRWAIWSIDSIVRLYPNAHLLFLGEGASDDLRCRTRLNLERFAGQYERSEIVHFLGNRTHDEVLELLPHGSLFWNPASVPGSGLAMLEAMAAGVPVVTTATPGIEWLVPPNAGEWVPVHDETLSIAAASHRILSQPERTAQICENARQWVSERFPTQAE